MPNEITTLEGFILINKPPDISSFDCIRHLKRIIKNKKIKIGHTGTLDNFACGLLIICTGRKATKFAGTLTDMDKKYLVKAKLGELTDTLDLTGKVCATQPLLASVSSETLRKAIIELGNSYVQTPPIYSALKHHGRNLYELARKQKMETSALEEIARSKSRQVLLHKIELFDFNPPFFAFEAHVSKGTYIRSLANDIAQKLDLYATTYELTRTEVGPFKLEKATALNDLQSIEGIQKNLIRVEDVALI
jgi:tRNA pseudouridine55 synthase